MQIKPGHKFIFNNVPYVVTKPFGSPENKCWIAKSSNGERWFTDQEIIELTDAIAQQ
jgi:hypothetical protein